MSQKIDRFFTAPQGMFPTKLARQEVSTDNLPPYSVLKCYHGAEIHILSMENRCRAVLLKLRAGCFLGLKFEGSVFSLMLMFHVNRRNIVFSSFHFKFLLHIS